MFCFVFPLELLGQEEQGCLRERASLHHFLSTQTLRNEYLWALGGTANG